MGRLLVAAVGAASLTLATACSPAGSPSGSPSAGLPSAASPGSSAASSSSGAGGPGDAGSRSAAPQGETPPAAPAVRTDAVGLATVLTDALRVVRDGTDAEAVRRAGEQHQLAVHALAAGSERLRRRVHAALPAGVRGIVDAEVRAALALRALTRPQPKLPRWRIVAPPPPAELRSYYLRAQRRTGVPWSYLAAIHLVETRMGRIRGTSTAGARGPMQFLPETWKTYGAGGDIDDPRDAILAAGRLLRAHGAPADLAGALWHYNPSVAYVRAVTEHARVLRRAPWVYRSYWHWQVLYRHVRGTYLLPVGYPRVRPVLVAPR